ncbi:hypothetical protein D9619_009669 [Psilocybe cf. subviscida]|uniref:Uncharacterized protein n=1 Tax=Psilocybe cf. subviscida TaxID=2480587 RepID=A0A8H5F632_9AGAR|nr:hypothetical protein D9619_009669 [Psilocybe cf. subviscida]
MTPVPIIAFGPTPDSYFIGVGMRYYSVGMPDSLAPTANKLPAIQMGWMSIDPQGAWMVQDAYHTSRLEYDTRILPNIIEQWRNRSLKFVSFGDLSDGHIQTWVGVGPDNSGNWTGILSDQQLSHLNEIKGQIGEVFDRALRGILLGKGSTMVFMFAGGFSYYTDDEAEGRILEKVMDEYVHRQPAWTIERGSVLCPWNIDYFFLKFKDTQSSRIIMRWNLPQNMDAHLKELQEAAETPEGAAAIARHEQLGMWRAKRMHIT